MRKRSRSANGISPARQRPETGTQQAKVPADFGQTATTAPEDKEFVGENYLREEFPEGLRRVDLLLFQAGMLEKNLTPAFAVQPAAEETLLSAADKWLRAEDTASRRAPSPESSVMTLLRSRAGAHSHRRAAAGFAEEGEVAAEQVDALLQGDQPEAAAVALGRADVEAAPIIDHREIRLLAGSVLSTASISGSDASLL